MRIRKEYNDKTEFLGAELSYKGSRRGNLIEIRPDTSIQFDSEDEVNKLGTIFNRLGYQRLVCFTKKRERWKLGKIEFEVDKEIFGEDENAQINLGSFCQASIETEKKLDENEIIQDLWEALDTLGYSSKDYEKNSYIELFFLKRTQG